MFATDHFPTRAAGLAPAAATIGIDPYGGSGDVELEGFVHAHRRRVVANVWRALAWPVALFVLIAAAVGADLAADLAQGVSALHLGAELAVLVVALCGVFGTALKLRSALRDGEHLLGELELTNLALSHWRRDALAQRAASPTR